MTKFIQLLFLTGLLFIINILPAEATHNRAGQISYEQIGELTIRATVTTYTKESSVSADRDSIRICWGDEANKPDDCQWVIRSNGKGESLTNDTKINFYIAEHTYPGRGHYTISMTDPNRNGQIINVNPPHSENVQFHLETTVTFLNSQFQGVNNSPILLQPPVDIGCVGQVFIHNPNAYDPDGDSLSYHLIVPLQDIGIPVPNYSFPQQLNPGANNFHDLNEITGDFVWTAPQKAGEYNIAMIIVEYRNGVPLDTMIRDMQILIKDCENLPPEIKIDTEDKICVVAGETLEINVIATAPISEDTQKVDLQAFGGPFEVGVSPANFIVPSGYQDQPLAGKFIWQTTCEHISDQYYSVIFRSADNFPIPISNPQGNVDHSFLSTLKTIRIKVVGPPPEDVQINPLDDGQIELTWEKPYSCEEVEDDYFQGFSVWRKEGSNQFPIDTCRPGLDGRGYTKIEVNTTELKDGRYFYLDTDVDRGRTYCYRVLAEFAKISAGGFPYNRVESLPSEEKCSQLSRDIPLITNVDVLVSDATNGQIEVRWSKPLVPDLDTIKFPGPYRYQVFRTTGISETGLTEVPGASFVNNSFAAANDTVFIDTGLNTIANAYSYQIAFYVNGETEPLGMTEVASSIFLTTTPTDRANQLSWQESVPWNNYQYIIFRKNPGAVQFDSIATTTESTYLDSGLINEEEYCYYIRSIGSYGIQGIINPIINHSQQVCSIPNDNVPPCPPVLAVSNICDQASNTAPEDAFINKLSWTNPNNVCPNTNDVLQYNVYYTQIEGGDFNIIETLNSAEDTTLAHQPDLGIAGCYVVTAIDTVGNESSFSNIVCIDNCPIYELPNVFTPNGDQHNDLFIPINNRFVDRIDIKIVNRWGQLVFETKDPQINWDGKNLNGDDLAEGTYFYTVIVFENRVTGVVKSPDVLSGFIELVRGKR